MHPLAAIVKHERIWACDRARPRRPIPLGKACLLLCIRFYAFLTPNLSRPVRHPFAGRMISTRRPRFPPVFLWHQVSWDELCTLRDSLLFCSNEYEYLKSQPERVSLDSR